MIKLCSLIRIPTPYFLFSFSRHISCIDVQKNSLQLAQIYVQSSLYLSCSDALIYLFSRLWTITECSLFLVLIFQDSYFVLMNIKKLHILCMFMCSLVCILAVKMLWHTFFARLWTVIECSLFLVLFFQDSYLVLMNIKNLHRLCILNCSLV